MKLDTCLDYLKIKEKKFKKKKHKKRITMISILFLGTFPK